MGPALNISTEEYGNALVMHVAGRIDATSVPILERKLSTFMTAEVPFLLIDFSHVDYLSSAGLRLLLSTTKKMKSKNGKCLFAAISDEVMDIIKMAGFDKILSIFPTVADALKALEGLSRT